MGWRDWIGAYAIVWLAPVLFGLLMLTVPLVILAVFEWLGVSAPFEGAISLIFGLGWVVIFAPMLTWIGLTLSVPIVWWVLRMGWGGWASFALGGAAVGALVAAALEGMHPYVPGGFRILHALGLRAALGWFRPEIFLRG